MSKVVESDDPDVVRLKQATRNLKSRGVGEPLVNGWVNDVYHPPVVRTLQLPAVFTPTHQTAGLPGFPAIDLFMPPGTPVLAAEDGELVWPHLIEWDETKRVGGWTFYWQGASGNTYFDTHFQQVKKAGRYKKGQMIGWVGEVPHGWWQSHIHHAKHKGRYNPPV